MGYYYILLLKLCLKIYIFFITLICYYYFSILLYIFSSLLNYVKYTWYYRIYCHVDLLKVHEYCHSKYFKQEINKNIAFYLYNILLSLKKWYFRWQKVYFENLENTRCHTISSKILNNVCCYLLFIVINWLIKDIINIWSTFRRT